MFHYKKNLIKYPNLKIIIVPHEFDGKKHIELADLFQENIITYSKYSSIHPKLPILFLDRKGILKYAYRYASIAVIGGGFSKGIHNITEAAVYGIPTIFGGISPLVLLII